MARILVVDDEVSYRDYLSRQLVREGHEVQVASGGREGVALGARSRPDLVVVDWMLKNHVHGLQVIAALGAVRPDVAGVMITGFPSRDLKAAAERAGIVRFIEKPFEMEEIRDAVAEALTSPAPRRHGGVALVDAGSDGAIHYANPAARALFAASPAGSAAISLGAVFGEPLDAEAASLAWEPVRPRGAAAGRWFARTQPARDDGTRLWLLRREDERVEASLVETLLGVEDPHPQRWPYEGRVLVVDDDELFRHVAVAVLESAGAACYSVETDEEAMRLLEHDAGFRTVVMDYEIPGGDPRALAARIRALRPEVALVGNSAFDRREDFAKFGVDRFLRKPWRPRDLVAVLE